MLSSPVSKYKNNIIQTARPAMWSQSKESKNAGYATHDDQNTLGCRIFVPDPKIVKHGALIEIH